MKKIKLSDIGVIHTGNTPPKKHEEYYNSNDINFIKPNDIPEDKVDFLEDDSIEYLSFQGAERGRVVPEGSVLVTCIGIIGKVAITTKEVAFNQQINAIVPNQDIVDAEFLAFKLWSERKKLMSTANKSVVPNINKTNFSNYEIEIPSLDKQRKIVNVLNKVNSLMYKRQQQIEALSSLKQSIFLDMFGDPFANNKQWDKGRIGDLTKSTQYGSSKKADENIGKYPILRMNNITYEGNMDLSDLKYIDLDEKDKEKHLVYKDDLLFNRTNSRELVGKTGVYNEAEPVAFAGYLIKLTPNEKANTRFISGYLNSVYGKKVLLNMAKNSIGMSNINAKELRTIPIYIPPIELQNKYAETILKIEEKEKLFKKGLQQFEILFNSISQKAFNGELFQDEPTTSSNLA